MKTVAVGRRQSAEGEDEGAWWELHDQVSSLSPRDRYSGRAVSTPGSSAIDGSLVRLALVLLLSWRHRLLLLHLLSLRRLHSCRPNFRLRDLLLPPASHRGFDSIDPSLDVEHASTTLRHCLQRRTQLTQLTEQHSTEQADTNEEREVRRRNECRVQRQQLPAATAVRVCVVGSSYRVL